MKRKIHVKKAVSITAAAALLLSMLPLAVFAAVHEEVYSDPETGISVSVDEGSDALLPKAATFQVVVNGKQVAEKTVEGLPATDAEITVKADGYDVFVEGTKVSVVASEDRYRLTYFGSDDSYTAVINIATEKTKDNIAITDGATSFGTFSWSKANADTSAFTRQVTIRVNGEEKWTQRVNTPGDLTNTMHTNQYWFTPNTALFKSAVTLSPAKVLDQLSNRDLTIDLTTVCGCGRDTCLCAGGCDCPVDCTCEDCMGTNLGDTQINTGFGLLEYKNPTGSGYNLTVEVYVNGQQEFVTDQLRVKSGEVNCLSFTPADGYYYHMGIGADVTAGYDFDTKNPGSTWDQTTGFLSIVGALNPDRDYDNVLKIYLWTFQNYDNLSIARRPWGGVQNTVEGYTVSFDALNPKTGKTETYTYDMLGTFKDVGASNYESIIIPTGTRVSLTAICTDGKEVKQWSTADVYQGGITLEGIDGQEDTVAYGNTSYLTVDGSWSSSVLLYIDAVGDVVPVDPTDPEESTEPTDTTEPEDTTKPTDTTESEESTEPTDTTKPEETTQPTDTTEPEDTTEPTDTTETTDVTVPTEATDPVAPEESTEPVSSDENPSGESTTIAPSTTAVSGGSTNTSDGENGVDTGDTVLAAVAGTAALAAGAVVILARKRK